MYPTITRLRHRAVQSRFGSTSTHMHSSPRSLADFFRLLLQAIVPSRAMAVVAGYIALLMVLPGTALAGAATHFSVVGPSPVTSYTTYSWTVTALDAGNAVDTTYSGTVNFTSTDPIFVNGNGNGPLVNG